MAEGTAVAAVAGMFTSRSSAATAEQSSQEAAGPSPGKATLTSGSAGGGGAAANTNVPAGAVQAPLASHVGETFLDGGHFVWRVEASGEFKCVAQPASATTSSVGARVSASESPELWKALCAMAIAALEPAAKEPAGEPQKAEAAAGGEAAAGSETAAAEEAGGFSLEGFLNGLLSATSQLLDVGSLVTDLVGSEEAAPVEGAAPAEGAAKDQVTHVVQSGETLQKIAAQYNVTVEALKSANAAQLKTWKTSSGGTVQGFDAGATIVIPSATPAPEEEKEKAEEPGMLDGAIEAIGDAIDGAVGAIARGWEYLVGSDGKEVEPVEVIIDEGSVEEGEEEAAEPAEMPAMSQFIWYGAGFEDLGASEVPAVAKVLSDVFGIGSPGELVTTPDASVKELDPNKGYWWFRADGTPTWNGAGCGGTQYVKNVIVWNDKLNDVSRYLASNPPGKRPAFMKDDGKHFYFGDSQDEGWAPVPDEARDLNLRNIPGGASCFATSEAMLLQAGVHAVGKTHEAQISGIVTNETYTETTSKYDPVAKVTVDPAMSLKAKTYIDWETKRGKPVFTGITYTSRNGNAHFTDHWVVIDSRIADGQYSFHDPGSISTEEAASDSNVFAWDGEKLQNSGKKKYVVSWVRPNEESLEAWAQYWASQQSGAPAGGAEEKPE